MNSTQSSCFNRGTRIYVYSLRREPRLLKHLCCIESGELTSIILKNRTFENVQVLNRRGLKFHNYQKFGDGRLRLVNSIPAQRSFLIN